MSGPDVKLTQFSHGAGCGCKIAPAVLEHILAAAGTLPTEFEGLLVGRDYNDDAAIMDIGHGLGVISTTDFFMPIVDDPYTFGCIAAANAISDVYAMGGKPVMAVAILGWPVNMLSAEIAGMVVRGAQEVCYQAGIPLAGGHSIDSPEPIFGLAVTGIVQHSHIKKNGGAQPGDLLFLTKPIGSGLLTTALKMELIRAEDIHIAAHYMKQLNKIGEQLGEIRQVHAMTDITGFGLAGHLVEMCSASNCSAKLDFHKIPLMTSSLDLYIRTGCVPAATDRNMKSYENVIEIAERTQRQLLFDPQTSGGLLIAVDPEYATTMETLLITHGLESKPIGECINQGEFLVSVGE